MNSIILSILAIGVLLVTASAAPQLRVETVVTEYLYTEGSRYPNGSKILGHIRVLTESGKRPTAQVGSFECVIKPTLRNNGTVDLSQSVTRLTGYRSPFAFGPYKSNVPLGTSYGPTVGAVQFSTKVSLPN